MSALVKSVHGWFKPESRAGSIGKPPSTQAALITSLWLLYMETPSELLLPLLFVWYAGLQWQACVASILIERNHNFLPGTPPPLPHSLEGKACKHVAVPHQKQLLSERVRKTFDKVTRKPISWVFSLFLFSWILCWISFFVCSEGARLCSALLQAFRAIFSVFGCYSEWKNEKDDLGFSVPV